MSKLSKRGYRDQNHKSALQQCRSVFFGAASVWRRSAETCLVPYAASLVWCVARLSSHDARRGLFCLSVGNRISACHLSPLLAVPHLAKPIQRLQRRPNACFRRLRYGSEAVGCCKKRCRARKVRSSGCPIDDWQKRSPRRHFADAFLPQFIVRLARCD